MRHPNQHVEIKMHWGPGFYTKSENTDAIAFLPPNDVIQGLEALADHLCNFYNRDPDDLHEYFEEN